ncbi:hypothetical protein ATY41_02620 [Leifsonia xyli subsp. xyli]|uniref:Uncharacterized protein n=1 Tax=Leifsonia xyli subsp. xyli TaxID=59736 RepID=A0A1E2SJD1_LEIXY|nr:hypothetical protein [Leifsonia xyli]ODA89952.1 hypothetical protein ATY41_02620 [Leifsonia xyli subsp. xyli]
MTTASADAFRTRGLVRWCAASGTNRRLAPPSKERFAFRIGGSLGAENEAALRRALTDHSLDPRLKLAILLLTVYGIHTHRLTNLRLRNFSAEGVPRVRLDRDWLELPQAAGPWIRALHANPGLAHRSTGGWLFPGYRHGRPLSPSSLAATLRQHGLSPARTHQESTANIISQVPPIVAARLLGVAVSTAADWHRLIATNTMATKR